MSGFFHLTPNSLTKTFFFLNNYVRIRACLSGNLFAYVRLYSVVSDPAEVKIRYIESLLSQVRKPQSSV